MQNDSLLAVKSLFDSCHENYQLLIEKNEVSLATEYKGQFSKVVLLACASYFETKVTSALLDGLQTKNCKLTHSFISRKALKRQYHTLFSWDGRNANSFFSMFGEAFLDFMKKKVERDVNLDLAIKNFLELGQLRNQLAHDDYALFVLDLTVENISEKFESAQYFVDSIGTSFQEYRNLVN